MSDLTGLPLKGGEVDPFDEGAFAAALQSFLADNEAPLGDLGGLPFEDPFAHHQVASPTPQGQQPVEQADGADLASQYPAFLGHGNLDDGTTDLFPIMLVPGYRFREQAFTYGEVVEDSGMTYDGSTPATDVPITPVDIHPCGQEWSKSDFDHPMGSDDDFRHSVRTQRAGTLPTTGYDLDEGTLLNQWFDSDAFEHGYDLNPDSFPPEPLEAADTLPRGRTAELTSEAAVAPPTQPRTPSPLLSAFLTYAENNLPAECARIEHSTDGLAKPLIKINPDGEPAKAPSGRNIRQFSRRIPDNLRKETPIWFLVMLQDIDPRLGPTDLIDRMLDMDWKADPKEIKGHLNCMSTAMQRYRQERGKLSIDQRRQGGSVTKSEMHALDKLSADQIRFNCTWEVDGAGYMRQTPRHPWIPAPHPAGNYTSTRIQEIIAALQNFRQLARDEGVEHWSKLPTRHFLNDKNRKGQEARMETMRLKKENNDAKRRRRFSRI